MMIVESRLSSRALGRGLEMPLLMSLGRALAGVLALYLALRLGDMARRGTLGEIVSGSRESFYFLLELGLGVVLPMLLLTQGAVRRNANGLYASAAMVVAGVIVNRLNVSITGVEGAQGGHYVPSLAEGIVTLMLVGIGIAAFGLAVRFLPVMEHVEEPEPAAAPLPAVTLAAVPARS
jgi:Ni/Fe-hydrogenase subunit HybB-like protein